MRKKNLLLLILASFLVLGLLIFLGDKGVFHLLRLQKELSRIQADNKKIEEENQKLREEVKRLQNEKRTIEEIARKELGMIKEDEVIYQFESPKSGQEPSK